MNSTELVDRCVIVTGAAGGLGAAIVDELLRAGLCVVGVDLAPAERAHPRFRFVAGDVTDEGAVAAAFASAANLSAPIAGLVTCVLAEPHARLTELTEQAFSRTYSVAVTAAWRWSVALHHRLQGRSGAIVHIGSVHAIRTTSGLAAYAAAKAALLSLTRSMALEWGPDGLRCNAVLPGFVRVARNQHIWQDPQEAARISSRTPLRRPIEPAEVAQATSFLLSTSASGITGAVLPVDGGLLVGRGLADS